MTYKVAGEQWGEPMSLFGSLNVGASGLKVSQYGMNVVAHNLANVDTEGYVRLDPKKTYLVFDFWAQKFLGEVTGKIEVPELKYGDGQVFCFREKTGRPQFLASTRHVSMDAVSVTDIREEKSSLTLKLDLPVGDEEKYFFYVPNGSAVKEVKAKGCEAKVESAENSLATVSVKATEKNCELSLVF